MSSNGDAAAAMLGTHPAPAISLRNVGKRYQMYAQPQDRLKQGLFGRWKTYYSDFWALRAVSIEVRPGEALGIIGRNGSGKSTLLQIIAGTQAPSEGEVEVRGRVAAHLDLAFARGLCTRDDLEERALAGPVASDDTQRLPGPDLDRHGPQRPKVRVIRLPASEESLFQPVLRLRVHLVALADVPQRDRRDGTRPERRGRRVAVRRHRRIPASS